MECSEFIFKLISIIFLKLIGYNLMFESGWLWVVIISNVYDCLYDEGILKWE